MQSNSINGESGNNHDDGTDPIESDQKHCLDETTPEKDEANTEIKKSNNDQEDVVVNNISSQVLKFHSAEEKSESTHDENQVEIKSESVGNE